MKATPLAAFAALFPGGLVRGSPRARQARSGPRNIYAVAGVHVDETAANAAAAQHAAFAAAQRPGFERLVQRLTIAGRQAAVCPRRTRARSSGSSSASTSRRSAARRRATSAASPCASIADRVRDAAAQRRLHHGRDARRADPDRARADPPAAAGNASALAPGVDGRRLRPRTRAARRWRRRWPMARRLGRRLATFARAAGAVTAHLRGAERSRLERHRDSG